MGSSLAEILSNTVELPVRKGVGIYRESVVFEIARTYFGACGSDEVLLPRAVSPCQ